MTLAITECFKHKVLVHLNTQYDKQISGEQIKHITVCTNGASVETTDGNFYEVFFDE